MRVTNSMLAKSTLINLNNSMSRLDTLYQQEASGKKINRPSDNPIVASRSLKFRTNLYELDQFRKNVEDAKSWITVAEDALSGIEQNLMRVRELALQGNNDSYSLEDKLAAAQEISEIKQTVIELANSSYAGRYIFAGFRTDERPFSISEDGEFLYQGKLVENADKEQKIYFELAAGNKFQVNIQGFEIFSSPKSGVTGIIETLDALQMGLEGGAHDKVSVAIEALDANLSTISTLKSKIGAKWNYLDVLSQRQETDDATLKELKSNNEDIDMAEHIINLKLEENVYQSSLATAAKIIQPSLLDFLR